MTELVIAGPSAVEAAADPARYVLKACERAKTWLAQALDHGDIEQIVELKSQAEAIRVYTMQKQLGKDAELSAAEIVRRAERGIGVAIRKGQEAGQIARPHETRYRPRHDLRDANIISPQTYLGTNGQEATDTYTMTDGVTGDEFDAVIEEAKSEGNLSRANVVRKVKSRRFELTGNSRDAVLARRERIRELAGNAWSSRQIAADLGMSEETVRGIAREIGVEIPADKILNRTRRHDPARIVSETITGLEGMCMGLELLNPDDFDQLDPHEVKGWSSSLAKSLRSLNQLKKELNRG